MWQFPILFISLYTFTGKIYTFFFYLVVLGLTLENTVTIHIPNLIAILACVYFVFRNNIGLKGLQPIAIICLIGAIILQSLLVSGNLIPTREILMPQQVMILEDIPNILAILIMLYLVYYLMKGKQPERKKSGR